MLMRFQLIWQRLVSFLRGMLFWTLFGPFLLASLRWRAPQLDTEELALAAQQLAATRRRVLLIVLGLVLTFAATVFLLLI